MAYCAVCYSTLHAGVPVPAAWLAGWALAAAPTVLHLTRRNYIACYVVYCATWYTGIVYYMAHYMAYYIVYDMAYYMVYYMVYYTVYYMVSYMVCYMGYLLLPLLLHSCSPLPYSTLSFPPNARPLNIQIRPNPQKLQKYQKYIPPQLHPLSSAGK